MTVCRQLKPKGKNMSEEQNKLVVFQDKQLRRVWYNEEWWFAVVDVIEVLTESTKPRDYWYRLKKRELESSGVELSTNCRQLKMQSSDGKKYLTECANTETMFRIIQSIPSSKAEPFKRWLAQVGYERVQEIKNRSWPRNAPASITRNWGIATPGLKPALNPWKSGSSLQTSGKPGT